MDTSYSSAASGLESNYMPSTSNSNWQDSSVGSASTSTSASGYSASSGRPSATSSDWNDSFGLGQRGISSPMVDTSPGFYPYTTSPQQGGASAIYDSTLGLPLAGYGEDGLPSSNPLLNTTVRSLTPPLAVAQSSETLVTVSAAAPPERLAATAAAAPQQSAYTRQPEDLLELMASTSLAPSTLSQEARSAIPIYIDVYWQKVASQYPVVHRSTLEDGSIAPEQLDLLRCSMAAVATQFLEDKNHRIHGNNLHSYAWHASKVVSLSKSAWTLADPFPVHRSIRMVFAYNADRCTMRVLREIQGPKERITSPFIAFCQIIPDGEWLPPDCWAGLEGPSPHTLANNDFLGYRSTKRLFAYSCRSGQKRVVETVARS